MTLMFLVEINKLITFSFFGLAICICILAKLSIYAEYLYFLTRYFDNKVSFLQFQLFFILIALLIYLNNI